MTLNDADVAMLSKTLLKGQRGVLSVRTQKESLTSSLDDRLKASQRPANGVSFGKLHIREFARRPGDNPGCRIGASLTIDWEVQNEMSVDMEAYEASRPPRRDRGELNIPSETRMQMLRDSGYSRGEILTYVKMANIARGQRNRTNETQQLAGAQELAQKLYRGVFNKTVNRSKKKKEKKLIQASMAKDQQMSVLRRQVTPEENMVAQQRTSGNRLQAAAALEQETPSPAPVRRVKRDSLAIMAAVSLPPASTEDDLSESSAASYSEVVDVDQAGPSSYEQEVDC